jgi:hypothetical protein
MTSKIMTDYQRPTDPDRLHLMLNVVRAFERGELQIQDLVDGLRATELELTTPSREWRDSFFEHWAGLEEVYSVLLDRQMEELGEIEAELVRQDILALKHLIEMELERRSN